MMTSIYVGLTDRGWFDQLSGDPPDEANFWQPSGERAFRALEPGGLFLFKLHSPDNFIVGGGTFAHASNVPLSMAWQTFGLKNGVASLTDMRRRIARYRRDDALLDPRTDPVIGCRTLLKPFFLRQEEWIPIPASWKSNIVSGGGYGPDEPDGQYLWNAISDRAIGFGEPYTDFSLGDPGSRTSQMLIHQRLGQGAFRLAVTDGYGRRCAVSGEKTLPILDAAHIKAFGAGGHHDRENGLLLRTDIHRLFDLGYVTVSEDHRFEVSGRLKADFDNGKHYYDLHGAPVRSPEHHFPRPSPEALTWHREQRYLG